jgi:hypothetical protein
MRLTRAGSVSRTIEKYDSLSRTRKSGLPTVSLPCVHNGEPGEDPNTQWQQQQQQTKSTHPL